MEKKKKKIVKARDKLLARYAKGLVDIDIHQVLDQLNQLNAKFPGSSRVIFFELSPEPIPVLHAI